MTDISRTYAFIRALAIAVLFSAVTALAQDPGPPEGIYAYAAGPTAIMVMWGSPANAPAGFNIYRNNQVVGTGGPNAGNFEDQKLSPNTSYTYKVCSEYGGDEFCTPNVTATTAASGGGGQGDYAPPTVTSVTATPTSLAFSWSATPNYNFYQARIAANGQPDTQITLNQSGHSGSTTYQQLFPSTQYTFKVQGCFSQLFNSSCSTWTQVEASTKAPPPIAPANFRALPVSYTAINLSWTLQGGISAYHLYRTPGMPNGQKLAPNVAGYGDTDLNPAVTYNYKLCADSASGTACATASLNPAPPPPAPPPLLLLAPINVGAIMELTGQVGVNWSVSPSSRVPGYFEIDHRVGIAPNMDTGASPWTVVVTNLPTLARNYLTGSYPALNGPLHHMFRVCAIDKWSRTCSDAVMEKSLLIPHIVVK